MTQNDWQGKLVRLRAVEPDDWKAFQAWDQDSDLQRLGWMVHFPRSDEGARDWTRQQSLLSPQEDNYRWVIENSEGQAVGSVNTHGCDRRSGTFEFGITIGREHWRNGYGSDAIRVLLRYFFGERRYQKVTSFVYDFNEGSLALHREFGFVDEGRIRRALYTGGAYHDSIVLGMTAEEFFERHAR